MKKVNFLIVLIVMINGVAFGQTKPFERLDFLIGKWIGTGSGFGNEKSKIETGFYYIMNGKYIEVKNDSKFEPTDTNPEGEHHIDWGIISYDKSRKKIIYRQFNVEGFVNQYVLNDSLSNDNIFIFETEIIENFVESGKAKWTVNKINENEIETIFELSFPGKEFACYGTNKLMKQ